MPKCPECNALYGTGDTFCPECGEQLVKKKEEKIAEDMAEKASKEAEGKKLGEWKAKKEIKELEEKEKELKKQEKELETESHIKAILVLILIVFIIVGGIYLGGKLKGLFVKKPLSANEDCVTDKDCISKRCISGKCDCSKHYQKCNSDSDCCESHFPYCSHIFPLIGKDVCRMTRFL